MLTAIGRDGWRDVQIVDAVDIHEAIRLCERQTGCIVSHGRGGRGAEFRPNLTIHADTGRVERHHGEPARPVVEFGPPDVMAAIAAAIR